MIRVLIADDENLSRQALRKVLAVHFPETIIVAEAENGRKAFELYKEFKPDLILMDIKMPGMDGLESSRLILQENPTANILIETAHDQFDYVQTAMKSGVKGYLLKPTMQEENIEKIRKCLQDIKEQQSVLRQKEHLEKQLDLAIPVIERQLLLALLGGEIDDADILSWMAFLDFQPTPGFMCMITTRTESFEAGIRGALARERKIDSIQKTIRRNLPKPATCILTPVGEYDIAMLLSMAEFDENSRQTQAIEIVQNLLSRISLLSEINVCIGLSTVFTEITQISDAWDKAVHAVNAMNTTSGVYVWCALPIHTPAATSYPIELESQFFQLMKTGSAQEIETKQQELVNTILSTRDTTLRREFCIQSISCLKREIYSTEKNSTLFMNYRMASGVSTYTNEMYDNWYRTSMNQLLQLVLKTKNTYGQQLISQLVALIDENGLAKVSLESLSVHSGYSVNYISRLFREEANITFIEYITERRINEAKRLLVEKADSIPHIAAMVGYEDPDYFTKIFKKHTGLAPLQYRRKYVIGGEN